MKKFLIGMVIIIGFAAGFVAADAFAADVAAKKDGVKVYADASKTATVVVTLKKDEAVAAGERKGMFWKVKTKSGKDGFVSVIDVTRTSIENTGLSKAIRDATQSGRSEDDSAVAARSRSSVMGVRGLDESEETTFAGNVRPNMRVVYAMEDRAVAKEKIDKLSNLVMKEVERRYEKSGEDEN